MPEVVIKYVQNRKCYVVNGELRAVWTAAECLNKLSKYDAANQQPNKWNEFWTRQTAWLDCEDPADSAWRQDCADAMEKAYDKFNEPPVVALETETLDLFGDL